MSVLIDMEMPKNCGECPLAEATAELYCNSYVLSQENRPDWCPLHKVPDESDIPIFDKETRIDNCTVQILENTETGEVSIGWWRNDE